MQERQGKIATKSTVVLSPNPRKERELLDREGNVIDPKTRQIIKPNEQ